MRLRANLAIGGSLFLLAVAVGILAPAGDPATGQFLNGLQLSRIPLFLFQAVLASLLPFQPLHQIYAVQIIGASGALYGLLMAYALYFPDRPILMFLLFPVPAAPRTTIPER